MMILLNIQPVINISSTQISVSFRFKKNLSTNKAPIDCLKSCSIPSNTISFHWQQDETEVCQWQTAQWLFIDCWWKRQGCKRRRQFLSLLELWWGLLFWMTGLKKRENVIFYCYQCHTLEWVNNSGKWSVEYHSVRWQLLCWQTVW